MVVIQPKQLKNFIFNQKKKKKKKRKNEVGWYGFQIEPFKKPEKKSFKNLKIESRFNNVKLWLYYN